MSKKTQASIFSMQSFTAGISTTLVLLLLGLVVFFMLTAHNLSVFVRENISFSILVSDDMKERDVLQLQKQLAQQPFVRYSEYISKEQARKEYTEAMGVDPTEFIGHNPLSASIEVRLKSAYANADSIARIEQFIKQNNNVQDVLYQKELINVVNDNISNISLMLLALAAMLALISFALINNTIQLAIYSQRFLIHTMKLVGASWGFIRRPFLRRNLKIGVLSAMAAIAILWAADRWLVVYEPGLERIATPGVMLAVSAAVLVAGILITWLCTLLSLNKYLRMKASTLYFI